MRKRLTEIAYLMELYFKRQTRIRNIASILFSSIIYPLGLYFGIGHLIPRDQLVYYIAGLITLFLPPLL
ncbi:hypothetical protein CM19_05120 [Candidatus Acidianus copahuensis]|uniref:Uncharacterized protein n=1 Tax=Candidatus Acidianus copahuensis TaxID=1160895 RepID=A0A031LQQ7_9CREN|nr:hypothetical protein [Candidatus Acidianus copahuensis]EZQ07095.1 hypothetical protein CM19_05120 [Candidatus Acidianus copahuensis]